MNLFIYSTFVWLQSWKSFTVDNVILSQHEALDWLSSLYSQPLNLQIHLFPRSLMVLTYQGSACSALCAVARFHNVSNIAFLKNFSWAEWANFTSLRVTYKLHSHPPLILSFLLDIHCLFSALWGLWRSQSKRDRNLWDHFEGAWSIDNEPGQLNTKRYSF